jgi:glycosyltransferase involved in cell wall biosynthesis
LKLKQLEKTSQLNPKKIFFVWNYLEWGGAQIYFFGIIKRLKPFVDVTVLLPSKSHKQLINFLDNLEVPYKFFETYTDTQPATTLKRKIQRHWNKIYSEILLLKYLNQFDLHESVLHIELAPWQSVGALLRLCAKTQVFVTLHNSLPPVARWRYLLWRIKFWIICNNKNFHIFASNEDSKNGLKRLVPKEFWENIKITYTNVNPDEIEQALNLKIDKGELLKKHHLPVNKFLVFCVGQFIDRKGRWVFLEAAQKILENSDDFHFVWISNYKLNEEEIIKIQQFKLKMSFTLIHSERVGHKHIDLFELMRIADIFALPSFVEGLPISLLEAMALGIPSISTNTNAIPEAVKHLKTGWLIEAGDAEGLSFAIEALKSSAHLREELSKNGRDFVLQHFNEINVAEIAYQEYCKAFENSRANK